MTDYLHECPTCLCPTQTSPQAWAKAHLIHTKDPADQLTASQAWVNYRTWFADSDKTTLFLRQNSLTKWLKEQGYRVELISGHNRLVGYRLAS